MPPSARERNTPSACPHVYRGSHLDRWTCGPFPTLGSGRGKRIIRPCRGTRGFRWGTNGRMAFTRTSHHRDLAQPASNGHPSRSPRAGRVTGFRTQPATSAPRLAHSLGADTGRSPVRAGLVVVHVPLRGTLPSLLGASEHRSCFADPITWGSVARGLSPRDVVQQNRCYPTGKDCSLRPLAARYARRYNPPSAHAADTSPSFFPTQVTSGDGDIPQAKPKE